MHHALPLALLCGCLSYRDAAVESVFAAESVIDWSQTVTFEQKCRESNPVLGTCGEVTPRWIYFPTEIAIHAAVASLLPEGFARTLWQTILIGDEGNTVWRNWQINRVGFTGRF